MVGWEWHGDPGKDHPGMEIMAYSPMFDNKGQAKQPHVATIYNGPKGNVVFNAGTIWYSQFLSSPPGHVLPGNLKTKLQGPDPRVQRMTKNVFDRFIK